MPTWCLSSNNKKPFYVFASVLLIICFLLSSLQSYYSAQNWFATVSHHYGLLFNSSNLTTMISSIVHLEKRPPTVRSKCSEKSDERGNRQKVVAFSLYGDVFSYDSNFERYVRPLLQTASDFPVNYPGWVMRIYHNYTIEEANNWKILNENFGLASQVRDHVDLCYVNDLPELTNQSFFAMTWRFLPLLDDLVDIYASRDSDSKIIQREVDAVHDWLKSNRVFHVMRDHPSHCIPMLGGLWGAKLNRSRAKTQKAARKMFRIKHHHQTDFDQQLLKTFIWPLARYSLLSHDSYCCDKFDCAMRRGSLMRPFPTQRPQGNFFVGNVAGHNDLSNEKSFFECPLQCRPVKHFDWNFC